MLLEEIYDEKKSEEEVVMMIDDDGRAAESEEEGLGFPNPEQSSFLKSLGYLK